MSETIIFSRRKLEDFLACQRRFQLRYLHQLAWPFAPYDPVQTAAMQKGEAFHQLVQRHYLHLPVPDDVLNQYDVQIRRWWQTFLQQGPSLAADERPLVEMTLTVPVGGHALLGRFDLIIVGPDQVRIFDWKTGKPRAGEELKNDWQTRLYFALAAEGKQALAMPDLQPEQISMTYWYAQQPQESVTISYSHDEHTQNWAEIQAIVTQVAQRLPQTTSWPLTDDLATCAQCPYQNYCGRFEVDAIVDDVLEERRDIDDTEIWAMEPALS